MCSLRFCLRLCSNLEVSCTFIAVCAFLSTTCRLLFTVCVCFTTCFTRLKRNKSLSMLRGDGKPHLHLFSNALSTATPATPVKVYLNKCHAVKVWNAWSLQAITSQWTINHWLAVTEQAATLSSTYSEFKGQRTSQTLSNTFAVPW